MTFRPRPGRVLWVILALAVSGCLLLLLGRLLDARQLVGMARQVPLASLAASAGIYALLNMWRALRFRWLHARPDLPVRVLFPVTLAHNLLVQTLPLRSGELAYVALARRHLGISIGDSVGALLGARLFEMILVLVCGLTCILLMPQFRLASRSTALLLGAACLLLCLAALFCLGPILRRVSRPLVRRA